MKLEYKPAHTMMFQDSILRLVVAQICDAVGYNSVTQQSMDILADVMRDFMIRLGKLSSELTDLNGRVEPSFEDLVQAFDYMGASIPELQDFITNVDLHPLDLKFPPDYQNQRVNRIQRDILVDGPTEATKNNTNPSDVEAADTNEDEITPSTVLMKDIYAEILNSFKDVTPVTADKKVRPPSPRAVSTVIKIKKTASPLPTDIDIDRILFPSVSRPKTLAERKALPPDLDAKSYLKISKRKLGEKKRGRKSLKESKDRERDDLRALKKKMASKTVARAGKLSKKENKSKEGQPPKKVEKKRGRKSRKEKEAMAVPEEHNTSLENDTEKEKEKEKTVEEEPERNNVRDLKKKMASKIVKKAGKLSKKEKKSKEAPLPKKMEKKRGRKSRKDKEKETSAIPEQPNTSMENDTEREKEKQKLIEEELEKKRQEEEERQREKEHQERERELEKEREKEQEKERQKERDEQKEKEKQREREEEREKTKVAAKAKSDPGPSHEPATSRKKKKASKGGGRKKKTQCIIITETVDTGETKSTSDEKEWICPGCGQLDDGSLMLECETCKEWYHFTCTNLTKEPAEDEDWYCDRCLKPTKTIDEDAPDADDIKCPVCDRSDDGSLMLQCEDPDCAKWFHGSCVDIFEAPCDDDPWFCKKCVEKQKLYVSAYDKRKRRRV